MSTAVSVIVPVYNSEEYLTECIQSILNQTLSDIELILVDDGSTDSSGKICDNFAGSDKRVKVIHKKNSGAAAARNTGLEYACGEFIGFVDSDDWIEPSMYSIMYESAKSNDADIVWCNVFKNENEKQRKYIPTKTYNKAEMEKEIYPLLISNVNEKNGKSLLRGSVCLRIFRKSMIERSNTSFPDGLIYNEDVLFCISATMASEKYVYLGNDYLYHNRYVPDSVTKRHIPNLWEKQRIIFDLLNEIVKKSSFDFDDQINKKLFDVSIYCIENACRSKDAAEIKKEILTVCSDKQLRSVLKKLDFGKMKKLKKAYYFGIKTKNPFLLKALANWRYRQ